MMDLKDIERWCAIEAAKHAQDCAMLCKRRNKVLPEGFTQLWSEYSEDFEMLMSEERYKEAYQLAEKFSLNVLRLKPGTTVTQINAVDLKTRECN